MNPALETLMLAFSGEGRVAVPERALFLGAEAHPELRLWQDLTGWQPLKPLAITWDKAGFRREHVVPAEKWPVVMVLPGKSRDEILSEFAMGRHHLAPGGTLVAAMPNTTGAGRFEKELSKATGGVTSLQKNKCRAFFAVDDGSWNEALFGQWRLLGEPKKIPGTNYTTRAGIFSSERIDPGSQLLLQHLPADLTGNLADPGSGWGFLSAEALRRSPKIKCIDLFESDARALDCARLNLAGEEVRTGFHWHDVTTGLPGTYDAILMNPPFHEGRNTDVDLGKKFLLSAANALRKGGRLFLVANRQLPYEAVLDTTRLSWNRIAEDKTYKIIFAEKR